tara:strand:+ start:4042 stop:4686 length:645 start_codon:yes stop_codon:yes gene_type:complete
MSKTDLTTFVRSGRPLSKLALAHHLGVDRAKSASIAKKRHLKCDGITYPWRRIWPAIYGIKGSDLEAHLAELKTRHPDSKALANIKDLEAELRAPLISFAEMALRRDMKPNTLSRRVKEGREILPFPPIQLGGRLRHFRPLEVDLWIKEEIQLDLPLPPAWTPEKRNDDTGGSQNEPDSATHGECKPDPDPSDPESIKKAIFDDLRSDKRTFAE